MSEFKGTKGKWEVTEGTSLIGVRLGSEGKVFAIQNTDVEGRANALLISKAPEMLDMLKMISDVADEIWNLDDKNVLFQKINFEEIQELIKQATEI